MRKRNVYYTENRIKIIEYCKSNNNIITKAQIMNLLNCSCDLAYEVSKSMVSCGILIKVEKCKFILNNTYL
jgi:hypothetical protein